MRASYRYHMPGKMGTIATVALVILAITFMVFVTFFGRLPALR